MLPLKRGDKIIFTSIEPDSWNSEMVKKYLGKVAILSSDLTGRGNLSIENRGCWHYDESDIDWEKTKVLYTTPIIEMW